MTDQIALMTKSELAEHLEVSKAYLSKPDVTARLEPAKKIEPDGTVKYDVNHAKEILKKTADPARSEYSKIAQQMSEPEHGGGDNHLYEVKTQRERVKLQNEEIDLEVRLGNTMAKQDVVAAVSVGFQSFREKLMSRNRSIAEQVATMSDVREIKILLDDQDRTMLMGISDDFSRRLGIAEPAGETTKQEN